MFIRKSFIVCVIFITCLPFFVKGETNAKIGKDSDYWGGSWRRKIDLYLEEKGFPRDGFLRKSLHTLEHVGRGMYQYCFGDKEIAKAEFKRAKENWDDDNHWKIQEHYFEEEKEKKEEKNKEMLGYCFYTYSVVTKKIYPFCF